MTQALTDKVCPRCEATNDTDTNFCGHCGADMRAVTASVSQPGASEYSPPTIEHKVGQSPQWIGRLIDSRYRVISLLGRGGMGAVYKVEHQRMGKIAAMKVLHHELTGDKEIVRRFRREAEAVSKLSHPNSVQTFDFGTWEGVMYLVMEFVRGEDMGALLRRDGAIEAKRLARMIEQVCGALSEAHELGIVHRDVKPENLMVCRDRYGGDLVKVLDFGLAKLSEREEAAAVTGHGAIVGTPYYMSPEQIRGDSLDARTDIYSLGAVMYRALTGEHPFSAQTPMGVLTRHLTDELVPPQARAPNLIIPKAIEAIVVRAMAKDKNARYASVDELRLDIQDRFTGVSLHSKATKATVPALESLQISPDDRRRAEDETRERLSRDDFDEFERSLTRRGRLRLLAVPLLLGLIVGAALWYRGWSKTLTHDTEQEPNNDMQTATAIALDRSVRGKLGQRISDKDADRDYYRIDIPAQQEKQRLSVSVSAIRNIDLAIAVYGGGGKLLATADNTGVGEPETVPNLGVRIDSALYVAVIESKEHVGGPTENVTDLYDLRVTLTRFADDEEVEPNNTDSNANPIGVDRAITGFFGHLGDNDKYRFEGNIGFYEITISGAAPVSVQTQIGIETPVPGRTRKLRLETGAVIGVGRVDEPDANTGRTLARGVHLPYTVKITPATPDPPIVP